MVSDSWMVCWPRHLDAGSALLAAAVDHLESWRARVHYADGALPGTYGVSDAWPHIQRLYRLAGFDDQDGHAEVQLCGSLVGIPEPDDAPVPGIALQRVVGSMGTSFEAVDASGEVVGAFEVDDDLSRSGSRTRMAGWADECNHWVRPDLRRRGLGTWLFRHGVTWLRWADIDRLLVYVAEDDDLDGWLRYYARHGLTPVNRTRRGWERLPGR